MRKALTISAGLAFALACADSVTEPAVEVAAPAFSGVPAPDITVNPSGDVSGVTDAGAIEDALNAADPGDIVELAAGTFYINRTLVVPGFNGTLRGERKAETTIEGVGTTATPFGNALMNFPEGPILVDASSFFFFSQPSGYLTVSELTLTLPDNFVAEANFFGATDLLTFFTVQLDSDECNTLFENLRLQGTEISTPAPPPVWVHQPFWGIAVLGVGDAFPSFSSGGNHVVKDSEISKVAIDATLHQLLKGASIEVKDNTLTDVKQIITRFLDGVNVSITRNTMHTFSFGAIVVTQEGVPVPGDLSNVVIRGNDIAVDGFAGIEIGFIPEATRPDFNLLIEKNKI